MSTKFEVMIEGIIEDDCQILSAAFEQDQLNVKARMLRLDSSGLSEAGRIEFYNFAADYAEELGHLDENDTAAIEALSEEMSKTFHDENYTSYGQSLESYIMLEYQFMDDSNVELAELNVAVVFQEVDLITPENVLQFKERYALVG